MKNWRNDEYQIYFFLNRNSFDLINFDRGLVYTFAFQNDYVAFTRGTFQNAYVAFTRWTFSLYNVIYT